MSITALPHLFDNPTLGQLPTEQLVSIIRGCLKSIKCHAVARTRRVWSDSVMYPYAKAKLRAADAPEASHNLTENGDSSFRFASVRMTKYTMIMLFKHPLKQQQWFIEQLRQAVEQLKVS